MNKVGEVVFGNLALDVYKSLDEPLFKASDIGNVINYSAGNTHIRCLGCVKMTRF